MSHARRRVCFVTGTRAEFGLMRSTLEAVRAHPRLELQIITTGMHLDPGRGDGLASVRAEGWKVDRVVPWDPAGSATPEGTARNTGLAVAGLVDVLGELQSDVVLVAGDRVEAFAAATAGHLSGKVVAHVHGGDRAAGLVDDSLRHAVTKLAHVHFPATDESARRVRRLGEQPWRIHRVGAPGIDGIADAAAPWREVRAVFPGLARREYALVVLHPADPDEALEERRAAMVLAAVRVTAYLAGAVVVYPNNDPGSGGIVRRWEWAEAEGTRTRCNFRRDVPRPLFLGLLRDAAVLVGNSSSGIIEAASFGTPVVDVGPRQLGRQHGPNVVHAPYDSGRLRSALARLWNRGRPKRFPARNVYGGRGTGKRVAGVLARLKVDERMLRKVIAY